MTSVLGLSQLIKADNLEAMGSLPDRSIDLIYVDPPFNSKAKYYTRSGEFAFADIDSTTVYLAGLKSRLTRMRDLLNDTGSIYVHVDWHASHHVRLLMDSIFGSGLLVNEIIWWYNSGGGSANRFGRKHDTILWYSRTPEYVFNLEAAREPYSEGINVPASKRHCYHPDGKVASDVWKIPVIGQNDKSERTGYPTQKPEALLRRIVAVSSTPGATVADFYCGSGTTCAVAAQLGRRWLGVDSSAVAIETTRRRLGIIDLEEAV